MTGSATAGDPGRFGRVRSMCLRLGLRWSGPWRPVDRSRRPRMESDCRGGHETPRVRDADRDAMLRGPGVARLHPGAIGDDGVRLMSYVTVPHPDGGYHRIAVRTHVPTD